MSEETIIQKLYEARRRISNTPGMDWDTANPTHKAPPLKTLLSKIEYGREMKAISKVLADKVEAKIYAQSFSRKQWEVRQGDQDPVKAAEALSKIPTLPEAVGYLAIIQKSISRLDQKQAEEVLRYLKKTAGRIAKLKSLDYEEAKVTKK